MMLQYQIQSCNKPYACYGAPLPTPYCSLQACCGPSLTSTVVRTSNCDCHWRCSILFLDPSVVPFLPSPSARTTQACCRAWLKACPRFGEFCPFCCLLHFCLVLPPAFTQPGVPLLAEPCMYYKNARARLRPRPYSIPSPLSSPSQ